jgi:hypothetical protein
MPWVWRTTSAAPHSPPPRPEWHRLVAGRASGAGAGLARCATLASTATGQGFCAVSAAGTRADRAGGALEQLRALWHGHRIAVHVTQHAPGWRGHARRPGARARAAGRSLNCHKAQMRAVYAHVSMICMQKPLQVL